MNAESSSPARHNVLVVCVDHWPGQLMGCAGQSQIMTPTLDALARSGTRFTNAYSECPVCVPARRSLMTGMAARQHGDRSFNERLRMPDAPTLAGSFRAAGYQAYAVGKLHVFPQRDRIGFDDVILTEEGRTQYGVVDDYEADLARAGYVGQAFTHGISANGYETRSWHLPENLHVTNWATDQMLRTIKRRDPTRPAFWYLSYNHPHPPLAPLAEYMKMYEDIVPDPAPVADWARDEDKLPGVLLTARHRFLIGSEKVRQRALRAFYALCTHIDHQLRLVIGTLREERLLDNTIILFTSDHGDMLGHHNFWAKRLFYQRSANIPMLVVAPVGNGRIGMNCTDDRLVGLQDVMPTLLDLAGIPAPATMTGRSMTSERRKFLYGEHGEGVDALRMIREGDWKLVYYPEGNLFQLFNLKEDPDEMNDLAGVAAHRRVLQELRARLKAELYGDDVVWVKEETWVGLPKRTRQQILDPILRKSRTLLTQRGLHWPAPPPSSRADDPFANPGRAGGGD